MKTKYLSLLIAGLMLCMAACKKSEFASLSVNKTVNNNSITSSSVDVYVAGYVITGGGTTAAYWKNGVLTRLGDSLSFSRATGIAVHGTDVYVAGVISPNNGNESAVVWKNGVATALTPGSYGSEASCIALQGNDVYIGGYIYNIASQTTNLTTTNSQSVYWKNGVAVTLPNASVVDAMAVNGTDVYIAGAIAAAKIYSNNNLGATAAYWKDGGSPVSLSYPVIYDSNYSSQVNAIAVSGTDVYVAGITGEYPPEYWKNDIATPLTNGTVINNANGIAVNGTDVFVVGSTPNNGSVSAATYWKNNVPAILSTGPATAPNSSLFSAAYAIGMNGADVYIAGDVWDNATNYDAAFYWKNDAATQLSNGGSKGAFASSIAVVPQ